MEKPIFTPLLDIRFNNWRFFKGKYANICGGCCCRCIYVEDCEASCILQPSINISGCLMCCSNCIHLKDWNTR